MPNAAVLATRYARRPLLIEPMAARALLQHIRDSDPRGMRTESRLEAALRKIGVGRAAQGAPRLDHDDYVEHDAEATSARVTPRAYAPLWAQQAYGDPSDEGFGWSLYEGAALMNINTALEAQGEYYCGEWYHGYDTILAASREALSDARVGGLFVRMNSPGGVDAGGLAELAAYWRGARAQAGGKPIHVYADQACSAAYWIAAQADRISAPRAAYVGSIGAVIVHESDAGLLAKAGIEITPIQFGDMKTAGAYWEALQPAARAELQGFVDQCGEDFVAAVSAGRPRLTSTALLASQARVYRVGHADPTVSGLAQGFVDAISTEQEAFASLLAAMKPASTGGSQTSSLPQALASIPKENAVAGQAPNAGRLAKLSASRTVLEARLARIKAEEAAAIAPRAEATGEGEAAAAEATADTDPCPVCDGTGKVDSGECPACDGTGVDPDAGPDAEAEAQPPADKEAEAKASADADRAAILASDEAKAHPGAALNAIRDGLNLAQFKGQLEAHAHAGRGGALRAAMAGARRLGPDQPRQEGGGGTSPLLADARRKAEAAQPRR